jgi:hypothetical protein
VTTRDGDKPGKKKGVDKKDNLDDQLLIKWLETSTNFVVNLSLGRMLEKVHCSILDIYFGFWFVFQVVVLIVLAIMPITGVVKVVLMALFT